VSLLSIVLHLRIFGAFKLCHQLARAGPRPSHLLLRIVSRSSREAQPTANKHAKRDITAAS